MFYFYVLQSLKNPEWLYKGSTGDLKRRFHEHNNGEVHATKSYMPLRLVYYEAFVNEQTARLRESSVKNNGNVWVPLRKRIMESLRQFAESK
jgi:putative endonuclease